MLFRPDLAQLIVEGRKTQTRRIVKDGDWPYRVYRRVMAVNRHGRLIWKVNDGTVDWLSRAGVGDNDGSRGGGCATYRQPTYAVQPGRGKPAIARIRFTAIRSEKLSAISDADIKAEGFCQDIRGIVDFLDLVAFRQAWDQLNPDKPYRWQDDPPVWVLTFALV